MDSITLGNYRCFHEKQTARLAPLTLLIGENSTGKTSFLALIRALWDVAYGQRIPDFKEEPYDLGSFREITYDNNESGSLTDSFIGGFEVFHKDEDIGIHENPLYFETTFKKIGTRPIPIQRFYSHGENSIEEIYNRNHVDRIRLSTARGSWEQRINQHPRFVRVGGRLEFEDYLTPVFFYLHPYLHEDVPGEGALERLSGSPAFTERDLDAITRLVHSCDGPPWRRPFASAPVRSKPHRTYDPSRPTWDPEGDYIPMYLASLYSQDNSNWEELRSRVEGFGRGAGLFDEILSNNSVRGMVGRSRSRSDSPPRRGRGHDTI